jgi:Tfp pilus assembly protein PilX
MISSFRNSRRFPDASRRREEERGFALIIAVTLLAFVVLLVVGLAALTKVETSISGNSVKQAQARANALVALHIALGQLQKYAGPDQRVTATAESIQDAANPHYTGVWFTNENTGETPKTWLVSGNEGNNAIAVTPTSATGGFVELVGEGSSGSAATVMVPSIDIKADGVPGQTDGTTIGHYAWWVGDEGVKADVTVPDRASAVDFAPYATPEAAQTWGQQMGTGGEAIGENKAVFFDYRMAGGTRPPTTVLALPQLSLGAEPIVSEAELKANYFSWGHGQYGVLADSADGGLRQDLSLDSDLLGTEFTAWTRSRDPGQSKQAAPVLSYFYLLIGVRKQTAASPYTLSLQWAAALWNPYTTALAPEDLRLEVSGLPDALAINARKSNAPAGSASTDVTVSLRGRFGDPLKILLPWDKTGETGDVQSWLPGRTYNWVSTPDASFDAAAANPGRFYSRDLPGFDKGLLTTVDSTSGANGSSYLTLTLPVATTLTVKVFRKDDAPYTQPLATFTSPVYAAVPHTDEFKANGHTSPLGFIFRLAESFDYVATDPSEWLTQPGHDVRDATVGADALVAPPNGPDPAQYRNFTTVSAPERFFDRDITKGTSYDEDVPLFELPGSPILSMGELQQYHLDGVRPFAIGNPWGEAARLNGIPANALFDRFFFSGLTTAVTPADGPDMVLPNSLLRVLPWQDGKVTTAAELKASPEAASSRYLLQRGAFNVNSQSSAAWASVLTSLRYSAGRTFRYRVLDPKTGTAVADSWQNLGPAGAAFFRFPQTAQETFQADDDYRQSTFSGLDGPVTNVPLYRRGLRVLSAQQVWDLADKIVQWNRVKRGTGPFRNIREFLAPSPAFAANAGGPPRSLLEAAIADAGLNTASVLSIAGLEPEFSSQWLTPADIMNALAPVLFARSDTFVIRAYGDVVNPTTGRVEARAWCQARVQRTPEPFSLGEGGADIRLAPGPYGRKMKLVFLRWLQSTDL